MKIVFFGASKFVIPIIEALDKNFTLALIITTETLPVEPVSTYAKEHTIPFRAIKKFDKEIVGEIKKVHAPLAVLAYFGLFIPQDILHTFPKGILNIHPSLLPLYRGPTPLQTAMIHGDSKTGTTLIKLDEQIDHGPILDQIEEEISSADTTVTLHDRLFKKGAELLLKNVPLYMEGKLIPTPQDEEKATYTDHLTRQSGYVDFANPPAPDVLDRMIRAYYPWPGVWTKMILGSKEVRVKFLPNQHIQAEGGKPMKLKDFLNGYPEMKDRLTKLVKQS